MSSPRSFLLVLCIGLTSLACALLFALSTFSIPSIEDASSYIQGSATTPLDADNGDINISVITLLLWCAAGILALLGMHIRSSICPLNQAHSPGVGRAAPASKREEVRGIAWGRRENHSLGDATASRRLAGFVCGRGCCS
jgi:hypothetical protein